MKKNILFMHLALLLFLTKSYPFDPITSYNSIKKQPPAIKFVCTAALIPENYAERKKQYIKSLLLLKKHGLDPYIIESSQTGPTFLDEYCNHVCYTKTNNPAFPNHGLNEALSLIAGLKFFNFDPDDIIIKFTGRYSLETDDFIRLVKNNPNADAIVRMWSDENAYTALFAIKLSFFLDFLENNIDYKEMDAKYIPLESFFGKYITKIKTKGAKIVCLERVYDYLPIWTPHR